MTYANRALAPRPAQPGAELFGAAQPQRIRRHRHRRVLVQQRHERIDVEPLERVDVAGEQLLLVTVDGAGRVVHRDVAVGERRSRAL
jgi:hypothetical protein